MYKLLTCIRARPADELTSKPSSPPPPGPGEIEMLTPAVCSLPLSPLGRPGAVSYLSLSLSLGVHSLTNQATY